MNATKSYALVTGASSGIGFQYARVLAEKGYNLLIVSNEGDAIIEKGECLRKEFPVEVIALMRDLGQPQSAKELYDYCQVQNMEVEVLVNNAGVYRNHDFLQDSEAYNNLILNLHVNTPAMLIYYFGQEMLRRCKGYILNMSSITSDIAVQRLAAYGATKAFLKHFSRSLHIELYGQGVMVTVVRPGAVATNLYRLSSRATKIGLMSGFMMTPERLAKRGVRALFRGRCTVTPGFINHWIPPLIALLPTCMLRLIRKWGVY